jgi:hypothetical protein
MKIVITENKVDNLIRKWLDSEYTPDYGWHENNRSGTYQDDVDKWGDLVFFINDVDSYIYYGCNANAGPEDEYFAGYGPLHDYDCPLLHIYPVVGRKLTSLFGNLWKPIFKQWFEENTGLEVKQITDDYLKI